MQIRLLVGLWSLIFFIQHSSTSYSQVIDRAWSKDELNNLPEQDNIHGKTANRKAVPYVHVREADMVWSKRIWRTIDLKEKMNQPLFYPEFPVRDRKSLIHVLLESSTKGNKDVVAVINRPLSDTIKDVEDLRTRITTAFKNEQFSSYYKYQEVLGFLFRVDSVWVDDDLDPLTPNILVLDSIRFRSSFVTSWNLVEDWFFDRQRSVMEVRILGIAPVMDIHKQTANGEDTIVAKKELCWFYFPEIRPALANAEVYNRHNNAERMSYDDLFQKRFFSSYITKVENVYDRPLSDYLIGIDCLLKAEKIKNDLFKFEHDTWEW